MLRKFELLPRNSTPRRRSGVTVIVVLALLAVAMTLFGIWTRSAVREERQLRQRELQLQCQRLAQAGVARAAAQLADDPEYTGETWDIAADELGGRHASRVQITATPTTNDSIEVHATAVHPVGAVFHVRSTEVARVAATPPSPQNDPANRSPASGDEP